MTFQEAVAKKKTIVSPYIKKGMEFRVFVTPENHQDNIDYLAGVRWKWNILTDEDSIQYSKNNMFKIQGLYLLGGNNVVWDDI